MFYAVESLVWQTRLY